MVGRERELLTKYAPEYERVVAPGKCPNAQICAIRLAWWLSGHRRASSPRRILCRPHHSAAPPPKSQAHARQANISCGEFGTESAVASDIFESLDI
jgi:hypothetical protein